MKLLIRSLDQKSFNIDINISKNVLELKQRLAGMPEITLSVEQLQLIYAGRIMEDTLPLSDYNIEDGKFIVMMGKNNPVKVQNHMKEESVPPTPPLTAQPSQQVDVVNAQDPPPSLAQNDVRVQELINMGYGEEEVRSALQASFNHPERAIEYLISGIPTPDALSSSSSTASTSGDLTSLLADPRFAQVRDVIRQNPELLEVVLRRIGESDPATFEAIRNHQQEFVDLLNNSDSDIMQVNLTAEERSAVERLMSLGFRREMVIQVYLACDKNEELAADILFRDSEDDDPE